MAEPRGRRRRWTWFVVAAVVLAVGVAVLWRQPVELRQGTQTRVAGATVGVLAIHDGADPTASLVVAGSRTGDPVVVGEGDTVRLGWWGRLTVSRITPAAQDGREGGGGVVHAVLRLF